LVVQDALMLATYDELRDVAASVLLGAELALF
jgi:hypothetical protein